MNGLTLELIVNDGALWGLLGQHRLAQRLDAAGSAREFAADLEQPQLTFGESDPIVTTPHLIASVGPTPRTVRWGWALPHLAELPASRLSARLRDFGHAQQIPQLASEEVSFDDFAAAPDGVAEADSVAQQIGIIAAQIIGEVPWFAAPTNDSHAVLLLQGAELPAPALADLMTVLPQALLAGLLTDPSRAIQHLVDRVPTWQSARSDTGVQLSDSTGTIDVHLDDSGQVTEVQTTI